MDVSITETKCKSEVWKVLPVAVVIIVVVASQGCQAPQADRIREKYLCSSIHPHLEAETNQVAKKGQEGITFMPDLSANLHRQLQGNSVRQTCYTSQPQNKYAMGYIALSFPVAQTRSNSAGLHRFNLTYVERDTEFREKEPHPV